MTDTTNESVAWGIYWKRNVFCELIWNIDLWSASCIEILYRISQVIRVMPQKGLSVMTTTSLIMSWTLTHWGRDKMVDIFKCICLNEIILILIKISLKSVPKGPINNMPALVQIMAWHLPGDKPSSEPMMVRLPTHICITRPQWVKMHLTGTFLMDSHICSYVNEVFHSVFICPCQRQSQNWACANNIEGCL